MSTPTDSGVQDIEDSQRGSLLVIVAARCSSSLLLEARCSSSLLSTDPDQHVPSFHATRSAQLLRAPIVRANENLFPMVASRLEE